MIVVRVEGDTVHLMGSVGTPLSPAQWREAAAALFPGAGRVKLERMQDDGFDMSDSAVAGLKTKRPARNRDNSPGSSLDLAFQTWSFDQLCSTSPDLQSLSTRDTSGDIDRPSCRRRLAGGCSWCSRLAWQSPPLLCLLRSGGAVNSNSLAERGFANSVTTSPALPRFDGQGLLVALNLHGVTAGCA